MKRLSKTSLPMRKSNKKRFFYIKLKNLSTLTLDLTGRKLSQQKIKILKLHGLQEDSSKSQTCLLIWTRSLALILKKQKKRNMTKTLIGLNKFMTYGNLVIARQTRRHRHIQPQEIKSRLMHTVMKKTLRRSYKRQNITSRRLTTILRI